MAAIITSDFRKTNADTVLADVTANLLYIGIGRSDEWENSIVPLPTTSDINIRDAKESLIGLKMVESAAKVVPRVDYSTTKRYKQWDPTDHLCVYPTGVNNQCYAVYDGALWLCINSPVNGSWVPSAGQFTPSAATLSVSTTTGDHNTVSINGSNVTYGVTAMDQNGYRWAFLGKIPTNSKFTSTQFVEIPPNLTGVTVSGTAGKIYSAKITSAGSGYTSSFINQPIIGDGSGGTATITVDVQTGKISNVQVLQPGSGYTYGMIQPGSGGGRIDFFAGPLNASGTIDNTTDGYGRIPSRELPCWFVGLATDISGDMSDIPLVPFSQLSVLRSPLVTSGGNNSSTYSTLRYFDIPSSNTAFVDYQAGSVLTLSNGAKVFLDKAIAITGAIRVYYHRNSSKNVNYIPFTASDNVIALNGATLNPIVDITAVSSGNSTEYTRGSGQVMFLENFKKKGRTATQTDQIRLIIQL